MFVLNNYYFIPRKLYIYLEEKNSIEKNIFCIHSNNYNTKNS